MAHSYFNWSCALLSPYPAPLGSPVLPRLRNSRLRITHSFTVATLAQILPLPIGLNENGAKQMQAIAMLTAGYRVAADLIDSMHQLRARIFRGRLEWDVDVRQGRETDEFDSYRPTYILAVTASRQVVGSARLLGRP